MRDPLLAALEREDAAEALRLLAACQDGALNEADEDGDAVDGLIVSALDGLEPGADRLQVVRELLRVGAHPARRALGTCPLCRAAMDDDFEVAQLLLEHGAEAGGCLGASGDGEDKSPLHCAAKRGSDRVAAVLLAAGADPNAQDGFGHGALQWAAEGRSLAVLQRLLKAGADPDLPLRPGDDRMDEVTPLTKICRYWAGEERLVAVRSLAAAGADLNRPTVGRTTALHLAANANDLQLVSLLLELGANPTERDTKGRLPAELATGPVGALLARQKYRTVADPEAPDRHGRTALIRAAMAGSLSTVEDLVSAGACLDALDTEGCTALIRAAIEGHADVVRALAAAGADLERATPEGRDLRGGTALRHALWKHNQAAANALLEAGARGDAGSATEATPLVLALRSGFASTAKLLIERNVDVASRAGGEAAIVAAVIGELPEIVATLVPRVPAAQCVEALVQCTGQGGTPESVWALVARVDVDERLDGDSRTPLWYAAVRGRPDMIQCLAELGADVNHVALGKTALSAAAVAGSLRTCVALVDAGADIHRKGPDGRTALQNALAAGKRDIAEYLRTVGARE